jgi:hypothetical protein
MNDQDAVARLNKLIDRIDALESKTPYSHEFMKWHGDAENLIEELFDVETHYADDFNAIYFTPLFLSCRTDDSTFREAYQGGLDEARRFLFSLIEELE